MSRQAVYRSVRRTGFVLVSLVFSGSLLADDLTDSNELLCYGWSAARCNIEGECELAEPWQLNLPDFLRIDLRSKLAVSTETAPRQRETDIQTVTRENGMIILQGMQGDRAFSWLITESSGEGTLTVSAPDEGLTVFTNCTPIEQL